MENNKVKFDPGFAPVAMEYLGKVGYMYYMFNSIQDKKMKKINFNFIYKTKAMKSWRFIPLEKVEILPRMSSFKSRIIASNLFSLIS